MAYKKSARLLISVLLVLVIFLEPCFATVKPLGKIVVTTAGTRVQVYTQTGHQENRITSITICYPANTASGGNNTGKLYVGDSTVVGSTLVGVMVALDPGSCWELQSGGSALDAGAFYLDSDNNGAYALVTVVY